MRTSCNRPPTACSSCAAKAWVSGRWASARKSPIAIASPSNPAYPDWQQSLAAAFDEQHDSPLPLWFVAGHRSHVFYVDIDEFGFRCHVLLTPEIQECAPQLTACFVQSR